MKKTIATLVLVALTVAGVKAQDVNEATDLYNNGATALSSGDNATALKYFQKAYDIATACGEAGTDIASDCAGVIPQISLRVAKDLIKAGNFDAAVKQLKDTKDIAGKLGDDSIVNEASSMIPLTYMQQGNTLLKDKNYAGAIKAYNESLSYNPSNGKAALNLGQAYELSGDLANAEQSYLQAAKNGQEKSANKKIANIYLKKAQASLKAGNYSAAVANAKKSITYNENPNAYYIAGLASQKASNNSEAIKNFEKYLQLAPTANNAEDVRKVLEALKKGN